jgi:hypothetical protein
MARRVRASLGNYSSDPTDKAAQVRLPAPELSALRNLLVTGIPEN